MFRSHPLLILLSVLFLAAAPLGAQQARPAASGATARDQARQATPRPEAQRPDTAAAASCSGDECDAGSAVFGDAERAVAAFGIALRELVKPGTWSGSASPRTSALRLLSTPLGRIGGIMAVFVATVWSLFNPGRALVIAAWLSGFALVPLAERSGRMWLGVASMLAYWMLLHYLLQRAQARRTGARAAWGDS